MGSYHSALKNISDPLEVYIRAIGARTNQHLVHTFSNEGFNRFNIAG
jgi:hypothetical protein